MESEQPNMDPNVSTAELNANISGNGIFIWITTFWLSQLWMSLRSESCVFIQNTVKRSANRKGIGLSGLLL